MHTQEASRGPASGGGSSRRGRLGADCCAWEGSGADLLPPMVVGQEDHQAGSPKSQRNMGDKKQCVIRECRVTTISNTSSLVYKNLAARLRGLNA